jgi:flagellar secretion chaperone FliS
MTTQTPAFRERYLADSTATVSPGRLLVMLYDRLLLDLERGQQSLLIGDRAAASEQLQHAQEIIMELWTSLDLEVWDGARGLASIYSFLLTELVQANVAGDAPRVAACHGLVEPLRDAWREVAIAPAEAA